MPRMLRRAAVLGATAHVASRRGQAKAEAAAEQQQAEAPPMAEEAPAPPPAPAPAAEPAAAQDTYGDLLKLKELLDAGALTQAEFDAEKQKVLSAS